MSQSGLITMVIMGHPTVLPVLNITIKIIKDLDSYCRFKDQNGNLFTQYNSRSGNELNAGSGKAKIIEGQNKWEKLVGAECFYSIRYLDDRTFSIENAKSWKICTTY